MLSHLISLWQICEVHADQAEVLAATHFAEWLRFGLQLAHTHDRKPGLELDVDVLAPGYNTRQLQQLKVYIAHLFVSRITVYMSFLPAEWRQASAAGADYSSGEPHPHCLQGTSQPCTPYSVLDLL